MLANTKHGQHEYNSLQREYKVPEHDQQSSEQFNDFEIHMMKV